MLEAMIWYCALKCSTVVWTIARILSLTLQHLVVSFTIVVSDCENCIGCKNQPLTRWSDGRAWWKGNVSLSLTWNYSGRHEMRLDRKKTSTLVRYFFPFIGAESLGVVEFVMPLLCSWVGLWLGDWAEGI